jgi:hypothetical protein
MVAKITLAVIASLAFGGGVAVAATQLASSSATTVCVNDTNGLMRAASECREGEHAITIGGGGNVEATQNGTFTVPWGETGTGKVLPLTGVTVSGRCELVPPEVGAIALARILIEAASGTTMDAFVEDGGQPNPPGQTSILTRPISNGGTFASGGDLVAANGALEAIVTSNGATASFTLGGYVDTSSRTCIYLWQAVEAPN